jgi:hypothetical protein
MSKHARNMQNMNPQKKEFKKVKTKKGFENMLSQSGSYRSGKARFEILFFRNIPNM